MVPPSFCCFCCSFFCSLSSLFRWSSLVPAVLLDHLLKPGSTRDRDRGLYLGGSLLLFVGHFDHHCCSSLAHHHYYLRDRDLVRHAHQHHDPHGSSRRSPRRANQSLPLNRDESHHHDPSSNHSPPQPEPEPEPQLQL